MEFDHVGGTCSRCGSYDFLPQPCDMCKQHFCPAHAAPEQHGCCHDKAMPDSSAAPAPPARSAAPQCIECHRALPRHEALACAACGHLTCIAHRHAEAHQCAKLRGQGQREPAALPSQAAAIRQTAQAARASAAAGAAASAGPPAPSTPASTAAGLVLARPVPFKLGQSAKAAARAATTCRMKWKLRPACTMPSIKSKPSLAVVAAVHVNEGVGSQPAGATIHCLLDGSATTSRAVDCIVRSCGAAVRPGLALWAMAGYTADSPTWQMLDSSRSLAEALDAAYADTPERGCPLLVLAANDAAITCMWS